METKLNKKNAAGTKADELSEQIEERRNALKSVETQFRKIREAREKIEQDMQKDQEAIAVVREKFEEQFQMTMVDALSRIKTEADGATTAYSEASNALDDHTREGTELKMRMESAQHRLAELENVEVKKKQQITKMNQNSAKLAHELYDKENMSPDELLGPLLMEIDVTLPDHRHLVEQCISTKVLCSFLARTDAVRDKLNRMVKGNGISVYCYKGEPYAPRKRPDVGELKKFGITSWLDDALSIKPESRNDVLGVLRDMIAIDTVLLGTKKTMSDIRELQERSPLRARLCAHGRGRVCRPPLRCRRSFSRAKACSVRR